MDGFRHADLVRLLRERRAVRGVLMRGTLHLAAARDYLALRPLVQPVLTRALNGNFSRQLSGLRTDRIAVAGGELLAKRPRTGAELSAMLWKRWPGRDARSLAYAVQYLTPLVQVPPRGLWGASAPPTWSTAEAWLGRPLGAGSSVDKVVTRYLAAFGPASAADVRAWSGLTGIRDVLDRLRPGLRVFRDEGGSELFDLPDAPRPDPDTPAPTRFLPFYDNALLGHADRSRIMPKGRGGQTFTSEGLLVGTVLLDGFVGARWRVSRDGATATLTVEHFAPLRTKDRGALAEEGSRLLAFAVDDAERRDVRLTPLRR